MAEVIVQEESLVAVADAIREKTGGTEGLVFPDGFIEAIQSAGEVLPNVDGVEFPIFFTEDGLTFPPLPKDVLETNPYPIIRKNVTSGHYDLIFSDVQWYYTNASVTHDNISNSMQWYRIEISSLGIATEWTFYKETTGSFGLDTDRTIVWSAQDILRGSSTATEVYFPRSASIPKSNSEFYKVDVNSISDIANTIQERNHTNDTLMFPSGFIAAISTIQSGSDYIFNNLASSGSFTLDYSKSSFTFEHGLGRIPTYAIVFLGAQQKYSRTAELLIFTAAHASPDGDRMVCLYGTTSSSESAFYHVSSSSITDNSEDANSMWYYTHPIYDANETTISVGDATGANTQYLMSNRPYYWIVW